MNQSIHTKEYQSLPGVEPKVEEGPPINLGPWKNEVVTKHRVTKSNSEQSVPQQIPFHCLQWQLTRHTVRARVTGSINPQYLEVSLQMSSFASAPDEPASRFLLTAEKNFWVLEDTASQTRKALCVYLMIVKRQWCHGVKTMKLWCPSKTLLFPPHLCLSTQVSTSHSKLRNRCQGDACKLEHWDLGDCLQWHLWP